MTAESGDLRARLQQALGAAYTLERELGGGGMSRVFLAHEHALGRRVVIKVLAPELAHELSAERFAREIQLSSQLQHPNIVPVLAAGAAPEMPYYTMPFIDGESLRARLTRLPDSTRIAVASAIEILRDVARALAYAHAQGVVHRDIKPENILLAHDAAVVADFGVAKATAAALISGPVSSTLTHAGVTLGTPAYMSPEQAAGDPTVDHRADLYAWGVVAYELLAGAHPFAGRESVQSLITAHLVEQPRPLGEMVSNLPPAASAIVMRCLAKNPADRPTDAREIISALAGSGSEVPGAAPGAAHSGDVTVVIAGNRTPAGGRGRSRRLALVAAAVVTLATILALVARNTRGVPAASGTTAHDAYLRGKVRVSSENRQDNDAAIESLREAIAADPSLAAAHAELSRAYTIKAFYFAPDSEKARLNEDAEVAVETALSLDPKLAEAHFARGLLLWTPGKRFPHEQTVRAYRQALDLNPNLDEAHHQLGIVYFHVGLLDEARREIDKALAINPGNTLARFRIGVIDMYRGDYEAAYAIFNSTPLGKNPPLWAFQTATALFRLGRVDEATALIDKFLRDYPKDDGGVGYSVRAMMLAKSGQRREAEAAIQKSLELGRNFGHFHHSAYNIASAYALLGNTTEAIRWLQAAADNGFPCYPLFMADTQLDGLRTDRRYTAFMAKLKRDWEERKRTL